MSFAREQFFGPQPGPHLLITGGVHGDEFEPMAAIRRLIRHFQEQPLRAGELTLIPVVNEPAFQRGSRVGNDGLDLARSCPGRADGSPTEQIAHALSEQIRAADFYIDLHTGGTRMTVLPLTGYTLHPSAPVLNTQRRMARAFGLPIIWGTDPTLEGRSLSVARDAGIPAIYAEYLGGGGCDPAGVDACFTGCLRVIAELGLIADGPAAPTESPRIVEDARRGSGHMQTNHPAPCAGFLELSVKLGDAVAAGEPLGTITDPIGRQIVPLHAAYAGIVLVLHTFSYIDTGTSAVVILPDSVEPT